MEHEGSDYEDESAGGMYHAGDKFIKIWDASAYLDVATNPEAEWSANYDQTAITDAEILGSVVSGDGTYMQAVKTRQAIGRASFNKLYRMFSRSKLPKDLRLRFFESFIDRSA